MADSVCSHLLLLTPRLAPGGEERFNLTLLEQLTQRNIAVSVCATVAGPHPWQAEFARYTPEVFILPNFLRPDNYAHFLVEHIRTRQISTVLVASSLVGYALLPYLRAHCPNVVFVDYIHMVDLAWRKGGYARVSANAHCWLDLTIVSSDFNRAWLMAQGLDPTRLEVCTTNIALQMWDPAQHNRAAVRQSFQMPGDIPVILYAARLDIQKRPALLVEVLARLRQRGLKFLCLIAGDGPQRQWLLRQVARRHLTDSVRWLGVVEPQRIPEVMAASDIFCLPSANEGIALSLYEAMAMALPVVAADVGGQHELVTPQTGRLIPRDGDEARAYTEVLATLLASPSTRAALGSAARQRIVEHFPIERMTGRMLEALARAQTLAQEFPRSAPALAEAEILRQQVTELVQQEALMEHLFAGPPETIERGPGLTRARRWIKMRYLRPLYFWGLEHGLDWLVPLKLAYRRLIHS